MSCPTNPARWSSLYAGRAPWLLLAVFLTGTLVHGTSAAWAQERPDDSAELVQRYRTARIQALARNFLENGTISILPVRRIPVDVDSILAPRRSEEKTGKRSDRSQSFALDDVRPVRHLERAWFQEQYGDTGWSYVGSTRRLTFVDTAQTRDLRARLQAQFGAPTRTPAERDLDEWRRKPDSVRESPAQFEYWFVVNDSVPVRVMDVSGPLDRGVIVSTSSRYRDRLDSLRAALLGPLEHEDRAPYVDYFYEEGTRRWYRTGFDGHDFFRERISVFDIVPGRRPRLDAVQTGSTDAEEADSTSP